MICKKTNTSFLKYGFHPRSTDYKADLCYYHNPNVNRKNIKESTVKIIIRDQYACKMAISHLRKKFNL